MSTSAVMTREPDTRQAFDRLLAELRPKLHRYCARMTGSVIDGEDLVQEALVKAIEAFPQSASIANPEGWLFRIAHNVAIDFLRRRARREAGRSGEDPDMIVDPTDTMRDRQIAAASLHTFMRLPAAQRSSVILMDVLGASLQEIAAVMESTVPSVKATLHRGRARLHELAQEPEDARVPILAEPERSLLAAYVDRFNARDFDAIRNMLADEVQLELVSTSRMRGRTEVARYFHNYDRVQDWQFIAGLVEGRPAVLVHDPRNAEPGPTYFVLLKWVGGRVTSIRDFRHARYAIEGAALVVPSL